MLDIEIRVNAIKLNYRVIEFDRDEAEPYALAASNAILERTWLHPNAHIERILPSGITFVVQPRLEQQDPGGGTIGRTSPLRPVPPNGNNSERRLTRAPSGRCSR